MVQRFDGLRHHAVVGCNHEDGKVGDLSTTRTHGGKRLVTRGVNEGDGAFDALVLNVHLVGTDVLGDSTSFASHYVRLTDGVEQTSLTVVYVTHHGNHWWTRLKVFFVVFVVGRDVETKAFEQLSLFVFW